MFLRVPIGIVRALQSSPDDSHHPLTTAKHKYGLSLGKIVYVLPKFSRILLHVLLYEGWNFNSGNYLFTTDTK